MQDYLTCILYLFRITIIIRGGFIMKFKKSIYNIEIDKLNNGDILLFNTLTCAFGKMDKNTQDIYNNIENIEINTIYDEKNKENINVLKSNGFIVAQDIDESARMHVLGKLLRYNKGIFRLDIAPTMNCNMECPYCFENKTNKKMDSDMVKSLTKFVSRNIETNNVKDFEVTWYGGEPLLAKEIIMELSKEFINVCTEKKIKYRSQILTNGSLLDYNTAKFLKNECNINMAQITIDGLKEVNNARRKLKNGKDSFDIIINNIEMCKDIIPIVLRVNVDKSNMEDAKKLISYFIDEKKWGNDIKLYFAPVQEWDNVTNSYNTDYCYDENEFSEIDSKLFNEIYSRGNTKWIDMLYPKSSFIYCDAIRYNTFAIDPDGNLYTCREVIGDKKHSIGNITNGIAINESYSKWLTIELPDTCVKCSLLPLCQGGCPRNRVLNNSAPICDHRAIEFKQKLKIIYEKYNNEKRKNVI